MLRSSSAHCISVQSKLEKREDYRRPPGAVVTYNGERLFDPESSALNLSPDDVIERDCFSVFSCYFQAQQQPLPPQTCRCNARVYQASFLVARQLGQPPNFTLLNTSLCSSGSSMLPEQPWRCFPPWTTTLMITIMTVTTAVRLINGCNNNVYLPCADTTGSPSELSSPPRTPFNIKVTVAVSVFIVFLLSIEEAAAMPSQEYMDKTQVRQNYRNLWHSNISPTPAAIRRR